MFVAASPAEAIAVLRAMRTVASADNTLPLSAADARGISSAFNTVFGQPDDVDVDALPTITPTELGDILSSEGLRLNAIRMLSVMALNDGVIEDAKLALVGRYASALDVRADFVAAMAALLANDIAWAAFDQIRHNVATIPPGMPWIPPTIRTGRSCRTAAIGRIPPSCAPATMRSEIFFRQEASGALFFRALSRQRIRVSRRPAGA